MNSVKYFNNTILLQNTLLPYFCNEYPLIFINKQFQKLNYEKYSAKARRKAIYIFNLMEY